VDTAVCAEAGVFAVADTAAVAVVLVLEAAVLAAHSRVVAAALAEGDLLVVADSAAVLEVRHVVVRDLAPDLDLVWVSVGA